MMTLRQRFLDTFKNNIFCTLFHILFGMKQGNNNIFFMDFYKYFYILYFLWFLVLQRPMELIESLPHTLFSLVFGLTMAYCTDGALNGSDSLAFRLCLNLQCSVGALTTIKVVAGWVCVAGHGCPEGFPVLC